MSLTSVQRSRQRYYRSHREACIAAALAYYYAHRPAILARLEAQRREAGMLPRRIGRAPRKPGGRRRVAAVE